VERLIRIAAIATFALTGLAGVAQAQEDSAEPRIDQSKVYVSDPGACQALEQNGVQALFEGEGFLMLTFERGIDGMEFNCHFFDIKERKGNRFLFVDAVCELPGEVYPDTMSISPYDDTQIQVVSTHDTMLAQGAGASDDPEAYSGSALFTRCDNLSEIPR
jgi:hypothetical protein